MINLKGGSYYLNGRGDRLGPMDELAPGVWVDQYGTWYTPNGREMNHTHDSAGNLYKQVDPWSLEEPPSRKEGT
jgi:hypothetical protein